MSNVKKEPTKQFVRGNEYLKAPHHVEYIPKKEYKWRVKELAKCKKNPIYFAEHYYYIINPEKGKHIIKLYSKQRELIRTMVDKDRVVVLASRQVGKTTAYNIFALWTAMFYPEQSILICANTGDSASEFVSRIRMAYELIPMWLKPGVLEWNKRSLKFSNESKIMAAPTSPGVRGKTGNILILDEMAWVDSNIEKEFWEAVYPVVSSSTGTKVIMVSTPNGTGNLFFETWDRAVMGLSEDGWTPFRIDWFEVPGRDEAWKKKQIASLNGDMRAWAQEFGNQFFGSSQTLIEANKIREFKEIVIKLQEQEIEPTIVNMGTGDDIYKVKIWEPVVTNGTYVIGADGGEGIGGDSSTILVFNISNVRKITLAASYGNNEISIKEFAYLLTKVASTYNNAFIGIENNGITKGIVDDVWSVYEYDNLVNVGKVGKQGIYSTHKVKVEACLWLKSLIQTDEIKFDIREPILVNEMEYFERKHGARSIFQAVGNKHDDYMMAFIWAMYIISGSIIEDYYNVTKFMKTSYGLTLPERIYQYAEGGYESTMESSTIDQKFNDFFGSSKSPGHISEEDSDLSYAGFLNDQEYDDFYE